MTPEQLAELFVEEQCDNTMNIHTCIEILIKQAFDAGFDKGYQYAVEKACDVITSIIMDAYDFDGNPLLPQDIREQFKQAMEQ